MHEQNHRIYRKKSTPAITFLFPYLQVFPTFASLEEYSTAASDTTDSLSANQFVSAKLSMEEPYHKRLKWL